MSSRYQGAEATWTQQSEADQEQNQAATGDAYRAANWLRMASRIALEWIEIIGRPGGFFLDMKYQTCPPNAMFVDIHYLYWHEVAVSP